MSKYIENGVAFVRPFPGSSSEDMKTYVEASLRNDKPDSAIIHVGCVDILRGETDARKIAERIFEVARACRWGGVNKIYLSGILIMNDFNHNLLARKVNNILNTEGTFENFIYIDNNRITKEMFFDRVHFNDEGRNLLASNFIKIVSTIIFYIRGII